MMIQMSVQLPSLTDDDPDDGTVAENSDDDNKREDDGPETVGPALP
jgi:hypothetical protein